MKKICIVLLIAMVSISLYGQSVVFLHHSTGAGVYGGGIGLAQWFTNYNTAHSTNYAISEKAYPDSPYPWDNYPYDYWNIWINSGKCDNTKPGIYCLDWFISHYNVIIFKHCFPGAGIVADAGTANIASSTKSIQNYKLQYRALRQLMDGYPNNKFIVWTLAPLHRNATDAATAARAKQFVDWVKNTWLTEDGKQHPNIKIFDFYGLAAESNATPAHGQVNCLKYDYEGDHNGNDSHPNATANATIMPIFGQFIVDVLQNTAAGLNDISGLEKLEFKFYPNPTQSIIKIEGTKKLESVEILNMNGSLIRKYIQPSNEIDVSTVPKGTYIIKAELNEKYRSKVLIIN